MKLPLLSLLGLCTVACVQGFAAEASKPVVLTPDAVIEIPGKAGGFDFLKMDVQRHRLLASHTKAGTLDIIDLSSLKLLARVELGAAQDSVADPFSGDYFVSVSDRKQVAVVDPKDFHVKTVLGTGEELDAIVLDTDRHRVYAAQDHGRVLYGVETRTPSLAGVIPIPGDPEVMVYDAGKHRLYLNIVTTHETVAIDTQKAQVVERWSTLPAEKPHGLALDADKGRLFVAGANGVLCVLDTGSGKLIASAKIGLKTDQVAFDPANGLVYAAADTQLSVLQETANGIELLGIVATPKGGKNVAVDPVTHAVWTVNSDGQTSQARRWVRP